MSKFDELLSDPIYDSADLTAKINEAFVDLYRKSPELRYVDSFQHAIKDLTNKLVRPAHYTGNPATQKEIDKRLTLEAGSSFTTPCPERAAIEEEIRFKAKELFPSLLDILKRKKFIETNTESIYQSRLSEWNRSKEEYIANYVKERHNKAFLTELNAWSEAQKAFDEAESARVDLINEGVNAEIREAQRHMDNFQKCDEAFLHESIQQLISTLEINFTAHITYMLDLENGLVALDVEMPQSANLPNKKVVTLASGHRSIQDKLVSEINRDHARCVAGLAFYLASHVFNISLSINKVHIAGYTEMTSPLTGNPENIYILEVLFDRPTFETLTVRNCHPEEAISLFKNQFDFSVRNGLKPIKNGDSFKIALMNRDEVISGNMELVAKPIDVSASSSYYESAPGAVDMKRLDPMFGDVARYIVLKQEGSTSRIQRAFEIGYNRSGKLLDQMEAAGIVGPNKGPKGRDVLIQDMDTLEKLLKELKA